MYAFGVIAYELLSGVQPFVGPAPDDYREQHLHTDPTELVTVPTALAALVEECLNKAPEARPTASIVLARLPSAAVRPPPGGLAQLQEANLAEVARLGEGARAASVVRSDVERALSTNDVSSLEGVLEQRCPINLLRQPEMASGE